MSLIEDVEKAVVEDFVGAVVRIFENAVKNGSSADDVAFEAELAAHDLLSSHAADLLLIAKAKAKAEQKAAKT